MSVQEGEMPEVEVETCDVEIGSTEVDVTVPTMGIEAPEEVRFAENN